jgi:hypothetical protein
MALVMTGGHGHHSLRLALVAYLWQVQPLTAIHPVGLIHAVQGLLAVEWHVRKTPDNGRLGHDIARIVPRVLVFAYYLLIHLLQYK